MNYDVWSSKTMNGRLVSSGWILIQSSDQSVWLGLYSIVYRIKGCWGESIFGVIKQSCLLLYFLSKWQMIDSFVLFVYIVWREITRAPPSGSNNRSSASHEFHETCQSVTFYVLVNSHQRWKQTQNRVCCHLWCELTLALWCNSIVWILFSWNNM